MSVWHGIEEPAHLQGTEGELLSARVSVDPRLLEDLLECLASLSFPVNPQIYHGVPTVVDFPVWEARVLEVRNTLRAFGFDSNSLRTSDMLTTISV